jgi:hypothetical protein
MQVVITLIYVNVSPYSVEMTMSMVMTMMAMAKTVVVLKKSSYSALTHLEYAEFETIPQSKTC